MPRSFLACKPGEDGAETRAGFDQGNDGRASSTMTPDKREFDPGQRKG